MVVVNVTLTDMDDAEQWTAKDSDDWGEHPVYDSYLREFEAERGLRWVEFKQDVALNRTDPMSYDEWLNDDDVPEDFHEYMTEWVADMRAERAEGLAEDMRLGLI